MKRGSRRDKVKSGSRRNRATHGSRRGKVTPPEPTIRVRRARRGDAARIAQIHRELAIFEKLRPANRAEARRLMRWIFDDRSIEALVALRGGRIEGVALFWQGLGSSFRARPFLFLEDLIVSAAARGAGIGEALMAALAREGVRRRVVRVDWDVLDWNVRAIRFYRRLGGRHRPDWLRYTLPEKAMRMLARSARRGTGS